MKTKFQKSLLKVLSFVFAISAFALVANLKYDAARAEEEPVAVFAVDNTASARIADDGYYGIKFTATVNNLWVAAQEAESIEFGILVYEKANAIEIGENSVEEVVAATSALNYTYPNAIVEGSYTFGGAVVCNSDDTDELNAFLATEYQASAYAIVDGELVWANGTYASSARKTAALSVVADIDNEDIYNKYYSLLGDVDTVVAKGDGKLFDLAVEDGAYSFMAADKSIIPVSIKEGKLAVDVSALANVETGNTIKGFLFADGNNVDVVDNKLYKVEFLVADTVVSTPQELQDAFEPTTTNTDYVALANDIDLEGFIYVGPTSSMQGVVDGRGYAIKNFFWRRKAGAPDASWTDSNSLFGLIEGTGVLKNISIVDFWDHDHWTPSIIAGRMTGTIENVYVRPRPGINLFTAFGTYSNTLSVWRNVVLDYQPIEKEYNFLSGENAVVTNYNAEIKYRAGKNRVDAGGAHGLCGDVQGTLDGVYVVSPTPAANYNWDTGNAINDAKADKYLYYFAENDNEMPYLDTIKNSDGTYTHTRMPFPSDMVTVLNNYNANLTEEQVYYEFDADNLTVNDFIKYTEVDGNVNTEAYRQKGLKRYNTFAEMAAAKEDLATFEASKFWSVVNGIPYWHAEVANGAVVNVGGVDVVGSAAGNVGRGQTTDVVVTYNGVAATINSITVANNKIATVDGITLTGVANGDTTITINYTWGGLAYNKTIKVETVNPIETVPDLVVYDADTKSFSYEFDYEKDGNFVSAYAVTPIGEIPFDDNFGLVYNPETNLTNVFTVFVNLEEVTYKFTNFEYWDYIIDNAAEYSRVMGYDADDGPFKKYVTLANNIDMYISDSVDASQNSPENNIMVVAKSGVVKAGTYYTQNNDDKTSHGDTISMYWGETNKNGFAGIFDGRGYSVSNVLLYKHATVNGNNGAKIQLGTNTGIFAQLYVDEKIIPVVKNVAYIDVITGTGPVFAGTNYAGPAVLRHNSNAIIENVYIRQLANGYAKEFNANGLLALSTINGYGANPLFNVANNLEVKNLVFEHFNSVGFNNGASGIHGSLVRQVGYDSNKYNFVDLDNRLSNVIYFTNGMLHSGNTAALDTAAEVATVIKNSGKFEFVRTYEKGFFLYGANETEGQQPHFNGFAKGATLENLVADSIVWAADDISKLKPGEFIGESVYKMKNVIRYKNRAAMADATHDLSAFTACKYWIVENGAPVWHTLATPAA